VVDRSRNEDRKGRGQGMVARGEGVCEGMGEDDTKHEWTETYGLGDSQRIMINLMILQM
jgi:hypothetical protein